MSNLVVTLAEDIKGRIERYLHLEPEELKKWAAQAGLGESDRRFFNESTDPKYLVWMCDQIIANAETWPVTKSHRWVGYVQGCLVSHGISVLETEKAVVREAKKFFPEVEPQS